MTTETLEKRARSLRRRMVVLIFLLLAVSGFLFGIIYVKEIAKDIKKYETPPTIQPKNPTYSFLPSDATDIFPAGNGWYEFTYKGQRFLYHKETSFHGSGYECIVKIEQFPAQEELEEF